jgi:hypothetical protein
MSYKSDFALERVRYAVKLAEDKDKEPGFLKKTYDAVKDGVSKAGKKVKEWGRPIGQWVEEGALDSEGKPRALDAEGKPKVWTISNPRAAAVAAGTIGAAALTGYGASRLFGREKRKRKRKKEGEFPMNIYEFASQFDAVKTAGSTVGGVPRYSPSYESLGGTPIPLSGPGSDDPALRDAMINRRTLQIPAQEIDPREMSYMLESRDLANAANLETGSSAYKADAASLAGAGANSLFTGRNMAIGGAALGTGVLAAYGIYKLRQRRKQRAQLAAKGGLAKARG